MQQSSGSFIISTHIGVRLTHVMLESLKHQIKLQTNQQIIFCDCQTLFGRFVLLGRFVLFDRFVIAIVSLFVFDRFVLFGRFIIFLVVFVFLVLVSAC